MEIKEPHVAFIASTDIEREGLEKYLEDIGAGDFEMNAPSGAEQLVTVGGKLCYKSFKAGLNPNVTKVRDDNRQYVGNINKVGHGSVVEHANVSFIFWNVSRVFCYHPETEVLTKDGWKQISKLTSNDLLLTKNPNTSYCRWSPNKKLHRFNYTGPLHYFENSQVKSPAITPDHIMWCAQYDLRKFRGKACDYIACQAEKMPMQDVIGKRFVIDTAIVSDDGKVSELLAIGDYQYPARDLYKWLGLLASDGTITKIRNKCSIIQTKEKHLSEIRNLMDLLFANRWKEYPGEFRICDQALKEWAVKIIGRKNSQRTLHKLLDHHGAYLQAFIYGYILGDGTIREDSGHISIYCGNSRKNATDLQAIIAKLGQSSNVRREKDRIGQYHIVNGSPIVHKDRYWILELHQKRSMLVKKHHQKTMQYDGYVYCPETDDGLVYIRHEGVAFWCGNTHELVRHRAGTAMSQESLRYVRLTDLSFWVPKIIDEYDNEKGEGRSLMLNTVIFLEEMQKKLADIYKIDEIKDFGLKKKLTSAFRRIAPIGLGTAIMWTMNMRAARHLIQIRTSRHAEEEIRLVFDQVAQILVDKYPHMFQDFTRKEVAGYGEWTSKYASMPYDNEKIAGLEKENSKLKNLLQEASDRIDTAGPPKNEEVQQRIAEALATDASG